VLGSQIQRRPPGVGRVRSSQEKGKRMEKERKRLAAGIQRTEGDIVVGVGPTM